MEVITTDPEEEEDLDRAVELEVEEEAQAQELGVEVEEEEPEEILSGVEEEDLDLELELEVQEEDQEELEEDLEEQDQDQDQEAQEEGQVVQRPSDRTSETMMMGGEETITTIKRNTRPDHTSKFSPELIPIRSLLGQTLISFSRTPPAHQNPLRTLPNFHPPRLEAQERESEVLEAVQKDLPAFLVLQEVLLASDLDLVLEREGEGSHLLPPPPFREASVVILLWPLPLLRDQRRILMIPLA